MKKRRTINLRMITIDLSDFNGYEYKDIYEYLMLQNENEFRFIYHKNMEAIYDDKFGVVYEYYTALYIGQQLYEVSEHFGYMVPAVYIQPYFSFECIISDMGKLAETLLYIVRGLNQDEDLDHISRFENAAADFMDLSMTYKNPVCRGLLTICEEFLE